MTSSQAKVFAAVIIFVLTIVAYRFIAVPMLEIGDAKVFSAPVDFRLGAMVKDALNEKHPETRDYSLSLDPDRKRRGLSMESPGTARLYGPKIDGQFDLKMTCRYGSSWGPNILSPWPDEVFIEDCVAN